MKGEKMCWSNYRIKCGVKVYDLRIETSLLKLSKWRKINYILKEQIVHTYHSHTEDKKSKLKISGQISWGGIYENK